MESKIVASLKKNYVIPSMQTAFDLITIILVVILLWIIGVDIYSLALEDMWVLSVQEIVDRILFILILIELFLILRHYLIYQAVSVRSIVEIGILAVGREVIFHVLDLTPMEFFGYSALLLVLGLMHIGEVYLSSLVNADTRATYRDENGENRVEH